MAGQPSSRPAGPRGRRLVGNTYDYDRDRIGFLTSCHRRYGDVFSFSSATVFVNDPELIREVLTRSNGDFFAEVELFSNGSRDSRSHATVSAWMEARRHGWRMMNRRAVLAHGHRLVDALDATLRDTGGEHFDVTTVMRRYAGRTVVELCLGPGMEEVAEAVERRSARAVRFMESSFTFPGWLPLPGIRQTQKYGRQLDELLLSHVRQRRTTRRREPEDLLDLLIVGDDRLANAQLAHLLRVNLLASYGAPGAALSWIVHELARREQMRTQLRREAAELHSATGSVVDDTRLPLTRAFVQEVLRLYPPTWLMGREAARTCRLGPWTLEQGQAVMFSPYLVQRDPRWWDRPDELLPERWLNSGSAAARYTYLPFGAGPRICLGLQMAMYQLVTATAQLAFRYDIELATPDAPAAPQALLLPAGLRARITNGRRACG